MSTQKLNPFYAIHPGEILKEEFQFRGLSQKKVSELIDVPYTMLNEILNCKRKLNTDVALRVEAAFGINADMLVDIQSRYNLQVAREDSTYCKHLEAIRNICATIL